MVDPKPLKAIPGPNEALLGRCLNGTVQAMTLLQQLLSVLGTGKAKP